MPPHPPDPGASHRNAPNFIASLLHALAGFARTIRAQRNMRIHCVAAIVALGVGGICHLTAGEWTAIVLVIGFVMSAELMNTAVEAAVDLATDEGRELAMVAKDAAAAAVLVAALTAIAVGAVVFLPKLPL